MIYTIETLHSFAIKFAQLTEYIRERAHHDLVTIRARAGLSADWRKFMFSRRFKMGSTFSSQPGEILMLNDSKSQNYPTVCIVGLEYLILTTSIYLQNVKLAKNKHLTFSSKINVGQTQHIRKY